MDKQQEIVYGTHTYIVSTDRTFGIGSVVIDKGLYSVGEVIRSGLDTMQVEFMKETKEVNKADYYKLVRKPFA